jgi:VanZ family protein
MMSLIFAASSLPAQSIPTWSGVLDFAIKKGGHMLGYGLLAIAMLRGVGRKKSAAYSMAWVLVVIYAVTDEYHQSFVPGRGASGLDVLIDGAGAAIALVLDKSRTSLRRV